MSRILEKLADQHEERIINVLYKLEEDIIKEVSRATKGQLVSQRLAIQLQPQIRKAIQDNFLNEADLIINEEYNKIAKEVLDSFGELNIPKKFKSLTEVDLQTINALKFQSFSGFEDIADRFSKVINDEIYQSTIAGRPFEDMVKNIRQHVNGVYQKSNSREINELVDFINENKFDESKKVAVEKAVKELQTQYGADRAGNNLRRYAGQIAHDSVMQFHGQFTVAKAKEAGIDKFTYTGTLVRDSREFCQRMLNRVLTEEQIREIWNTQSWAGKSTGDPFIVRGGYRCRHTWIPTIDETVDEIPEEPKTPKIDANNIDVKSVVDASPIGDLKGKSQKEIADLYNNKLTSLLTPLTTQVINKTEKPNIITNEIPKKKNQKQKAYYRASEKRLVSHLEGQTLAHEYGHHIDWSIADKKENILSRNIIGRDKAWSEQNVVFQQAFLSDKKNLNLTEEKIIALRKELYNYETEKVKKRKYTYIYERYVEKEKNVGTSAISDILDAMTKGQLFSKYRMAGHGRSYYIEKEGSDLRETFANLFSLQKNKKAMEKVNKYFPNLQKAFLQGMKDYVEQ